MNSFKNEKKYSQKIVGRKEVVFIIRGSNEAFSVF